MTSVGLLVLRIVLCYDYGRTCTDTGERVLYTCECVGVWMSAWWLGNMVVMSPLCQRNGISPMSAQLIQRFLDILCKIYASMYIPVLL